MYLPIHVIYILILNALIHKNQKNSRGQINQMAVCGLTIFLQNLDSRLSFTVAENGRRQLQQVLFASVCVANYGYLDFDIAFL